MRIAQALAGFTLGQADVLRKAMGKKDPEGHGQAARSVHRRRQGQRRQREEGDEDLRSDGVLCRLRLSNKSHSTAYAFLAYQTAYLKANYPSHFTAALLTIEAQNTDKLAMYLAEARERGDHGPPARHQSESAAVLGREAGRRVATGSLRPDGDQGPRRRRDQRRSSRRASSWAAGFRRCTRCARSSTCASPTSACSRRW